jgi:unconventional prefoldin RPB5 interactor 1
MDKAGLVQIEKQRQELEGRVSQLQKSLQHWQTWEIEYDGLREEIASLPPDCTRNEIYEVAKDFGAKLIDNDELETIIGDARETQRSQAHIVNLLVKRVDYVSRNVRTLEKLILEVREKSNTLLLAGSLGSEEETSLPPADIVEEIDDDGNVISAKVETSSLAAPQLKGILKKAGGEDQVETNDIVHKANGLNRAVKKGLDESQRKESRGLSQSTSELPQTADQSRANRSSSLADIEARFADDKGGDKQASCKSAIALESTHQAIEQGKLSEAVTTCATDTPEEAALRYDMVQYGLGEVGNIVAELELDEASSDVSYDDDGDEAMDFTSDGDSDEAFDVDSGDESDDENGMAKHPVISRKYLERMKMLEAKHGIKAMQNLGPDSSKLPKDVQKELDMPLVINQVRRAAENDDQEANTATPAPKRPNKDPKKRQKQVAFAADLDIAPERGPETKLSHRPALRPGRLTLEPAMEQIVERQLPTKSIGQIHTGSRSADRKFSQFRRTRDSKPQTPLFPPSAISRAPLESPTTSDQEPSPPVHQIQSDTIIERDPRGQARPPDPDEIDDEMHRQEIAGEYHKLRSRMIQYQGGFVGAGESDNYGDELRPLPMVDEDGKERKISRFRAARLK